MKAGFNENDINDFIAELSEEFENKDLSLADLFDKLFELPFEEASETKTETDQENFLEISALPFLESILNSLGIPREKTQEILNKAQKGDKGISLDVILEDLQSIQKKSFYTQNHYEANNVDDNFRSLFKQLGLEHSESTISQDTSLREASSLEENNLGQNKSRVSPLTLNELVGSLEKLRKKISQPQAQTEMPGQNDQKPIANEKSLDLFNALFKGVELENNTAETRAFDFSFEQIKNQFKDKFLVSVSNSLGLSWEKTQEILNKAHKGDQGISLDTILENLQSIQKKSFYTQNHYETKNGDDNFRSLFKQLGLEHSESTTSPDTFLRAASSLDENNLEQKVSPLTLNELVGSLEKLHKKISQPQAQTEIPGQNDQKPIANEKSLDLFNALFKGVELENNTAETRAFDFSFGQIKNQFKNKFLLSVNEQANKNVNSEINTKLNKTLKEMEFLPSERKSGAFDMSGQLKENKEFLKPMKSLGAKGLDQTQISTSDLKINETQSNLNMITTKSSFKNLPTYVTNQVQKSIVRAINQGESTLRIQLKPQELGRLIMTIDNTGKSMKISIMTESLAAKEILTSNVNELRTVLSNSGVNLERFDVDTNSEFKQSMADEGNQAGNSGKRNRNRVKHLGADVDGEGMNDPISLVDVLNRDGLHHFVA
ncbi:FliK: predicted flagellar hook-length control protein [Desulfobacula toluolica Tol2]|uniref:FliK: predicted flagellar hook-length control protein n=1 Tax=Desulfobacula toluolica (strain DSM 7467 / Tol2) TaxID=651182 RepID=K0NRZ3_DESTT|nr:FliK: predicted flagellar hook-length control protein [Desulfobacula toluolica Tol2]